MEKQIPSIAETMQEFFDVLKKEQASILDRVEKDSKLLLTYDGGIQAVAKLFIKFQEVGIIPKEIKSESVAVPEEAGEESGK